MVDQTKHAVNIPEYWLLMLAVRGTKGDDDLPRVMQCWAERECKRLGISEELSTARAENIERLRSGLTRTMGSEMTEKLEGMVTETMDRLKGRPGVN